MKAHVFKHQRLPGLKPINQLAHLFADRVRRKLYGLAEQFREPAGGGRKRILLVALAFGPAEVRGQNESRPIFERIPDAWKRRAYTRIIRNIALGVERHVEVDAHEDALTI